MKLHEPFIITPRLMAGVKIGQDSFISIGFYGETNDSRMAYQYFIDAPGIEHTGHDLASGVGGGSLQEGMASLLCFLGAAAESYHYRGNRCTGDPDDNSSMFPEDVVEWAYEHSDEISMLQYEIEESKTDLIEATPETERAA